MPDAPTTRPTLLLRLRDARDAGAWTQFVDLYAPLVYGHARRQGLQDADAADLTQVVLQAVAASVGRLEYDPERGSFRGWLFTIVRNKLRTYFDQRARHCRGTGDLATQRFLEAQPAPAEAAAWEEEYGQRLFGWAAEQIRGQFRESTWQAFWQTAVEGRPASAVAPTLGLSVAAVYLARSRVMARLKTLIQQVQDPELSDSPERNPP